MTAVDRQTYWANHRRYKSLIQNKKRRYHFKIATDIDQMDKSDPQEYWKYWKRHSKRKYVTPEITVEQFTDYYIETDVSLEQQNNSFILLPHFS